MTLGPVGNLIREKLTKRFDPIELEVIDESHHHAGHSGAHKDGESHFRVIIKAAEFSGLPMVKCHRLVNEALADELKERVHALALKTSGP